MPLFGSAAVDAAEVEAGSVNGKGNKINHHGKKALPGTVMFRLTNFITVPERHAGVESLLDHPLRLLPIVTVFGFVGTEKLKRMVIPLQCKRDAYIGL